MIIIWFILSYKVLRRRTWFQWVTKIWLKQQRGRKFTHQTLFLSANKVVRWIVGHQMPLLLIVVNSTSNSAQLLNNMKGKGCQFIRSDWTNRSVDNALLDIKLEKQGTMSIHLHEYPFNWMEEWTVGTHLVFI